MEHGLDVEATVCVLYQKVIFSPILFLIFQAQVYFPFFLKELKMNIASRFTPDSTASKNTHPRDAAPHRNTEFLHTHFQ